MQLNQKPKTVRILAMSDTHDLHHKIDFQNLPSADVFIHAGDFTKFSMKAQLDRFREFLNLLPYKHKIVIAGNHDFALDKETYEQKLKHTKHKHAPLNTQEEIQKLKKCCTYLQHEMVEVEGLRIFGSPYSPQFFDWGFMYAPEQGQQLWSAIPKNIDVLITHGPPFGILDINCQNENTGCKGLLKFVEKLSPKVHIFGHIHEGYGKQKIGETEFYNVSFANIAYQPVNPPILIDVPLKNKEK